MRMLLRAVFPPEPFNTLVRDGKAGELIGRIMEDLKPEAVYFTETDGCRSGFFVVNLQSSSEVPKYAEPFFLNFDAKCHFQVVMSPEDLQKAGLDALGQKWG